MEPTTDNPAPISHPTGRRISAKVEGLPSIVRRWRSSLVVGIAALVYYLATTSAVSGDKDASEFTCALGLMGVTHPTGYPIYTVLGHFFVLLVRALGGTWAYGANGWSAMGGAVALGITHRVAVELLGGFELTSRLRNILALLPVLLLGLDPIYTVETNFAEVYSWHTAWVAMISLTFLRLHNWIGSPTGREASSKCLLLAAFGWGFACGLGGAHHMTSIFFAAPLSIFIAGKLLAERRLKPALVLAVVVGAIVPLLSYGYIVWRAFHPAVVQWRLLVPTPLGLYQHISGAIYRQYLGAFAPSDLQRQYLGVYVYPSLTTAGIAYVVAMGIYRNRGLGLPLGALAVCVVISLIHCFNYGVPDPASYFLAPMQIALLGPPLLLAGLRERISATKFRIVLGTIAVALFPVLFQWNMLNIGRRAQVLVWDQTIRGMWLKVPDSPSFLIFSDDMVYRLREYQSLWGEKPSVIILNTNELTHQFGRDRFKKQFGFDPVDGLLMPEKPIVVSPSFLIGDAQSAAYRAIAVINQNINKLSPYPVIIFDPAKQSVRLMKKNGVVPQSPQKASP